MHFPDFDNAWTNDRKYHWVANVTTAYCLRNTSPQNPDPLSALEKVRLASLEERFDEVMEHAGEAAKAEREQRQTIDDELAALSPEQRAERFAPHTATSRELLSYVDRYNTAFTTDPVRMRPYFDACWASISQKFIAPQE